MGILVAQEMAERNKRDLSIAEIEEELEALEEREKELKALYASKCDEAIKEAVEKSVQERKIERISTKPRMFVVHCSDLIGKPWNVEYHDWQASKDVLMAYLEKKPANKWRAEIEALVASAKNGSIYIGCGNGNNKYKTPISLEFVQAVLRKIS